MLKLTDIPKFLPNKIRKCADEDGCMTEYKVPVQQDSYIFGYNSAVRLIREKIEEKRKNNPYVVKEKGKAFQNPQFLQAKGLEVAAYDKACQSILSLLEG